MRVVPFGKPLANLLASNRVPKNDIYLFVGHLAWQSASLSFKCRIDRTLCLPPFDSPNSYHWPVNDCDILIFDTGGCEKEYLEHSALTLLEFGAQIVRIISPEFIISSIFKRTCDNDR